MKKTTAFIMVFVMLAMTAMPAMVFAAGEDAVFTIGKAEGEPGDIVEVSVMLATKSEVNSIALTAITFDEDALEFVGFSNLDEIKSKSMMWVDGMNDDISNKTIMAPLKTSENYNGNFCSLKFKIKDEATAGDYEISAAALVKLDSQVLSSVVETGKITVSVYKPTPVNYSFGQSVQIGLIEPWFLKANARVYTAEHPTNIDYSKLRDFGAYFVRASALDDPNATQASLTVSDIINNPATVKYSKKAGTATVDGSYITANYDKGLYTYEMGDSVFVLFYVEDESGIAYAQIRERNIKSLLEARKNDTANFENPLERNVYSSMDTLEKNVGIYRAQFDEIEELPEQKALTVSEYVAKNGAFAAEKTKSYNFGNSVQLIIVEPWGLKVNARVHNTANPTNINYNAVEEYGAIVYYDTEGKVSSMTAEELKTKSDAYVFSSKNGDATIDGSYITALYNKGIYTYQLDSNAYVMFYVKDADGYHYGDVKVRNAYDLATTRSADTSGNFGDEEKQVYRDMVAMYEAIKAYRDDYFGKN